MESQGAARLLPLLPPNDVPLPALPSVFLAYPGAPDALELRVILRNVPRLLDDIARGTAGQESVGHPTNDARALLLDEKQSERHALGANQRTLLTGGREGVGGSASRRAHIEQR